MKIILLILGLTVITSCNSQSKNVMKISKDTVIQNIDILRSAGFFENFSEMSNSEVYDTIYAIRKRKYSELFERPYDPGMELDAVSLANNDDTKLLFLDLEADVGKDNDVYIDVIKAFSKLSNYKFLPIDITEQWESETGPIEVSFYSDGTKIVFNPEYEWDWLHESVFQVCEIELQKKDIRIVDMSGTGQSIALIRLTEEEQKIVENKLKWNLIPD